jgi:hypothetical protein
MTRTEHGQHSTGAPMLALIPAAATAPTPSRPPALQVHALGDASRPAVEAFIAAVYRARYGAEVRAFAPTLVSLRDADGETVAAAGYRSAADGALFLERYLGAPVDRQLAATRAEIVEVGHLAATRAGEGRRLITRLGPHLAALDFRWVVSTLTEELRHLFLRLGIAPRALGVADPTLLGEEATAWGRYYDHRPVVLAGALAPALQVLARRGEPA